MGFHDPVRVAVTVKAGSKRQVVEEDGPGRLKAWVKAPPVEGKANEAVVTQLAAHFSVPRSAVRLVRGATSKLKLFEIQGRTKG